MENEKENDDQWIKNFGVPYLAGLAVGIMPFLLNINEKRIPELEKTQEMERGFVNPNDLEITCEDLDNNELMETTIKIKDKHYLLREIDGKPTLSPYEIRPQTYEIK